MSYNIHHGEGTDGQLDLARIADVIRSERADIVALQEVDSGVARTNRRDLTKELAELTGLSGVFAPNLRYQGGDYGNAVLTRFPVAHATNYHYKMLRPGEQRGLQIVTLDIHGQSLTLMNTHLDYRPDPVERLSNVREIVAHAGMAPNEPLIICGDFNDRPGRAVYEEMSAHFADAWAIAGQGSGNTFPSNEPDRRIDYVWIKPSKSLTPVKASIPVTEASDHRPVTVEFRLQSDED